MASSAGFRGGFLNGAKTPPTGRGVHYKRTMLHYDVAIVGSGPAGERGATRAAFLGKKVAVIEKEAVPGGRLRQHGHHPLEGACGRPPWRCSSRSGATCTASSSRWPTP